MLDGDGRPVKLKKRVRPYSAPRHHGMRQHPKESNQGSINVNLQGDYVTAEVLNDNQMEPINENPPQYYE